MLQVIECAGHPRDMGSMQGRACRNAVAAALSHQGLPVRRSRWPSLAAFASGAVRGAGTGREIIRHYTHLSERIDGLARGAGVPTDGLLSLHAALDRRPPLVPAPAGAPAPPTDDVLASPSVALLAGGLDGAPGHSLVRGLPGDAAGAWPWLVRRSRPEVGFASVEVTLPWLVTAVAGINGSGLSVAFLPPAPASSPRAEAAEEGAGELGTAPPFLLLVQECLQRFEDVEAASDWCRSRPAQGHGTIVLADAAGGTAAVVASGAVRSRAEARGLPWPLGAPPLLAGALAEAASREGRLDTKALEGGGGGRPPGAYVHLVPAARRIELRALGGGQQVVMLEA